MTEKKNIHELLLIMLKMKNLEKNLKNYYLLFLKLKIKKKKKNFKKQTKNLKMMKTTNLIIHY